MRDSGLYADKRVGIYAGTFNPFTIGHADIVERALKVVDTLVILLGENYRKRPDSQVQERASKIEQLYVDNPRVKVVVYSGLVAEYAGRYEHPVLIRGVRSLGDLEYERTMADTHLEHFGLETLFLLSRPSLSYVSSSLVRELEEFGADTSRYLPSPK